MRTIQYTVQTVQTFTETEQRSGTRTNAAGESTSYTYSVTVQRQRIVTELVTKQIPEDVAERAARIALEQAQREQGARALTDAAVAETTDIVAATFAARPELVQADDATLAAAFAETRQALEAASFAASGVNGAPASAQLQVEAQVDLQEVEAWEMYVQQNPNVEALATAVDALGGPDSAAAHELLRQVIDNPNIPPSLFTPDPTRRTDADMATVANVLDRALQAGVIDVADLQAIAAYHSGRGEVHLMQTLMLADDSAAAEALARAWAGRGGEAEVAALLFASRDPGLIAELYPSAAARAGAMELLVDFIEHPERFVDSHMVGQTYGHPDFDRVTQARVAALEIFQTDPAGIVDRYTAAGGDTEGLARFFRQTIFDPSTPPHVVEASLAAFEQVADGMSDRLEATTDVYRQREIAAELGTLMAALGGGAALAIRDYEGQVATREAAIDYAARAAGILAGKMLNRIPGAAAQLATEELTRAILEAVVAHPDRPEVGLVLGMKNAFESMLDAFDDAHAERHPGSNPGTQDAFTTAYLSEIDDLERTFRLRDLGLR